MKNTASIVWRQTRLAATFVGIVVLILALLSQALVQRAVESQWQDNLRDRLQALLALEDVLPLDQVAPGLYSERYSGHYWQIVEAGTSTVQSSVSLADFSLLDQIGSPTSGGTFSLGSGPLDEPLLILAQAPGAGGGIALVARDRSDLIRTINRVDQALLLGLIMLWLTTILSAAFAARLATRPIHQLAREVSQLRAGERQRISPEHPPELEPLAQALNRVLELNEARMRRQREAAANLAHEIKTPLTALQQRAELDPQLSAEFVRDRVARIWQPLEQELARARIHGPRPGLTPTRVATELERALALCHADHEVPADAISIHLPENFSLPLEARDLFTVLWNLLDNALRHGGTPIQIGVRENVLQLEDSGSNLAGQGNSGAGLTLVSHILEAYDWSLKVDRSELGGRRCSLLPPGAT